MIYEYRCTSCGDQIVTRERLEDTDNVSNFLHDGDEWRYVVVDGVNGCGPLKRVWSVGIQIKSVDWGH